MEKELRCNSCRRILNKYEVLYIGGKPICPYCENDVIDINIKRNNKSKKGKSIFDFFK